MHIIILILGLIIGSFLNVCIYRIPRNESIAYPPSHCPQCQQPLGPLNLIPVLSYLLQRGRCHHCKAFISMQYPIVELINGLLWVTLYHKFGLGMTMLHYGILVSVLIVIFAIDYSHLIIPDGLNIAIFLLALVSLSMNFSMSDLIDRMGGLLLGGGCFLLIALISHGAMGGGDIKLMAALGFTFGITGILMLMLLSFLLGAVISVGLLLLKLKSRNDAIPFGPFITIATLLMLLWRGPIFRFYQALFM